MWGRGTVLGGRYALADRIGGGAMGEVWRAEDRVLERQVAVKILLPSRFDDDAFTVRFRREAKVLASIDHPGVVHVHDYGESEFRQDDGDGNGDGSADGNADGNGDGDSGTRVAYIVMELVEGRSLEEVRAESGVMPVAQALDLVAQALDALHAVHRRGVVHRDIKPSNLMLRSDGRVAVADFGIARVAARTRLTPSHAALGTPLYMAPEQAEGLRVVPASDLYSVGVVCYELLTGAPPFTGDTPVQVALKHIREPAPDLPAGFPEPVRNFVAQALAKDPEDRYANAAVMAAAARRAAAGELPENEAEPVPATTAPAPEPDPQPAPGPVVSALATKAERAADAPGWKRRGPVVLLAAVVVPAVTVTVLNVVPMPWASEASRHAGQPSASAPGNRSPDASSSGSASPSGKASASSTASTASAGGGAQDANTGVSGGSSAGSGSGDGSGDGGSGSKPSASSGAGAGATASTEPTPSAYATPGVSMSDDPKAIAGSEAFAGAGGGCAVWLDDNGSGYLYGMLNTSYYESCNAQLFRSDGLKVSLTARYGAERTTAISDIGHTMWICVWEKGDSVDTRQCSDRFGIHNGVPKAE